mmetsp:Transcript_55735/g.99246  ORF Transcript_55735/g.99246 Transcript_55735/m.99246 type:complete len:252 (-) Transcript_55735:467-1222(-)
MRQAVGRRGGKGNRQRSSRHIQRIRSDSSSRVSASVAHHVIRVVPSHVVRERPVGPVLIDDAKACGPATHRVVATVQVSAGTGGAVLVWNENHISSELFGSIVVHTVCCSDDDGAPRRRFRCHSARADKPTPASAIRHLKVDATGGILYSSSTAPAAVGCFCITTSTAATATATADIDNEGDLGACGRVPGPVLCLHPPCPAPIRKASDGEDKQAAAGVVCVEALCREARFLVDELDTPETTVIIHGGVEV